MLMIHSSILVTLYPSFATAFFTSSKERFSSASIVPFFNIKLTEAVLIPLTFFRLFSTFKAQEEQCIPSIESFSFFIFLVLYFYRMSCEFKITRCIFFAIIFTLPCKRWRPVEPSTLHTLVCFFVLEDSFFHHLISFLFFPAVVLSSKE